MLYKLLMCILVKPNIYFRFVSNHITGFMYIALASLIDGYWSIYIILSSLSVIGFNPSNVDALLYGIPIYSDICIIFTPGLLDRVLRTVPHIFLLFCCALIVYLVFNMCEVYSSCFEVEYFGLLVFLTSTNSFPVRY